MSWDRSKENIQPLRQGRRVEALYSEDAQSISKIKQDYLDKMNSALELDDPLDPFLQYMKWYKSVNHNLGNEYYHILKDCLHFFMDNNLYRRYGGDQRFLGIWLEYAEQYRNPQSIYEYMHSYDIGTSLAVFYEYWSRSLEVKGDYPQAEVILSEGVKQFAHPVRRLEKLLLELKSRIPETSHELSSSSQHDRSVLGQLTSHKGKVDSVRAGAYKSSMSCTARQQQGSSNRPADNFVVYRGTDNTASQSVSPLSQPNTAIPTREKLSQENTQPTSKWIKASIPSAPTGRPAAPVDFLIHADPQVPLSIPVSADKIPKHILKERPQEPEGDPLQALDMRPSSRHPLPSEYPMYPHWEVYPYGSDKECTSLEELRAQFTRYAVEVDTGAECEEDMELTCVEPLKKTVWDDPLLQKRVSPLQRIKSDIITPTDCSKPSYSQPVLMRHDTQEKFSSEPARTTPATRRVMGPVVHTPVQSYRDDRSPPQVYMSKYLVGQNSTSLSKSRSYEDNITNLSVGQVAYQSKSPPIDMVSEWKRGVSEKKVPRALPDKFAIDTDTDRKMPGSQTYSEMKARNVQEGSCVPSDMYRSKDFAIPQPPTAKQQQQQQQQQLSELQEDTMTVRSKKADAEILELFATTLPSEKDEIVNPIETVKVKKQIDFKFYEVENKPSDLSSMLPPPPSTLTYRTPAKINTSKFPDSSIDSSLFVQPTSTPMVGRNMPLSVQDITEIPNQEKSNPIDPLTLQFSQISSEENKENPSAVSAKETSSCISLEQRNEYGMTTKYLSPINEENSSSQNSSGKSLEETVTIINPFSSQTIKKMVNEYLSQSGYERLIDCTSYPAPTFVVKKTAMFGNVHFKILEHVGTGGFANVYLASPATSEARKLSPTQHPVLKVVMKQPTCIEYLISSKIHERLTQIKQSQLSPSFYQPYSCVMYKNSTILVSEYYPHGTLLDLINELKINRIMEETISRQLALEITNLVHTLHSIGIVHNDIKPDNFLLRYNNPITGGSVRKELVGNLLHLIDFGRSVDLSLFPKNVQFVGSSDTDTFELPCMKTSKPYLYNCDSFGLAATLYCIITFEYPRIIAESDSSNKVKLVRPIKSACRHYSSTWDSIIYKLMNAGSYEAMETIVEVRNEISDCITVSTLSSKWQ